MEQILPVNRLNSTYKGLLIPREWLTKAPPQCLNCSGSQPRTLQVVLGPQDSGQTWVPRLHANVWDPPCQGWDSGPALAPGSHEVRKDGQPGGRSRCLGAGGWPVGNMASPRPSSKTGHCQQVQNRRSLCDGDSGHTTRKTKTETMTQNAKIWKSSAWLGSGKMGRGSAWQCEERQIWAIPLHLQYYQPVAGGCSDHFSEKITEQTKILRFAMPQNCNRARHCSSSALNGTWETHCFSSCSLF